MSLKPRFGEISSAKSNKKNNKSKEIEKTKIKKTTRWCTLHVTFIVTLSWVVTLGGSHISVGRNYRGNVVTLGTLRCITPAVHTSPDRVENGAKKCQNAFAFSIYRFEIARKRPLTGTIWKRFRNGAIWKRNPWRCRVNTKSSTFSLHFSAQPLLTAFCLLFSLL